MRRVVFIASPAVWERGHGPQHPLKPERLQRTHALLDEYGAFAAPGVRVLPPRPAREDELALFHSHEYIDAVKALSRSAASDRPSFPPARYGFGPGDNPVFAGMYETEGLKVGGALQAAECLASGECDVAFNFSGGLHHGGRDRASGFCVFNDAAVAIHWLLRRGRRVAYVDVDVHHGDGVQSAFYDTDRVLTISLHQDGRTLFPGTGFVDEIGAGAGRGFSVNVPLPPLTDDDAYLWAFGEVVPPLLERFQADIVVTQLGVDTHYRDPLANLALTTSGQTAIFERLGALAPRWLALGGGGYDLTVVPRAWTLAFGVMSGQTFPDELPERYRSAYGGRWLRDQEAPALDPDRRQRVQQAVEAVVAAVKQRHGLA